MRRHVAANQSWDPERYARHARFVSDLGQPVVDLLAPQPGERVLDLGCGDGVLTAELVALGCHVVGIDASAAQVAAARRRGVDARVMDAEHLTFVNAFDAAFSNAALHWVKCQPDAAIEGVHRALVPGGRFVAELSGAGCVATIEAALLAALTHRGIDGQALHPWYFPTVEEYGERLRKGGFAVEFITLFPRPTPLPGDVMDWLENFAESFMAPLPIAERPAFVAEVRETLRPQLCDGDGRWTADYVRLRFKARRS
jgi:trans-aconitate methyltransferase